MHARRPKHWATLSSYRVCVCECVCGDLCFLTPVRLFRLSSRTFTVRKNAFLAKTWRSTSRKYFLYGRERSRRRGVMKQIHFEFITETATSYRDGSYFPWSGVLCSMKETFSRVSWSLSCDSTSSKRRQRLAVQIMVNTDASEIQTDSVLRPTRSYTRRSTSRCLTCLNSLWAKFPQLILSGRLDRLYLSTFCMRPDDVYEPILQLGLMFSVNSPPCFALEDRQ